MSNLSTQERIATLRDFVPRLRQLIAGLNDEQLTTAYNAPEWPIAQIIHHIADSHMHAFLRCKRILTTDEAQLLSFDEGEYAKQPDVLAADVELSLSILEGLHGRWVCLFENVTDWTKSGYHHLPRKAPWLHRMIRRHSVQHHHVLNIV